MDRDFGKTIYHNGSQQYRKDSATIFHSPFVSGRKNSQFANPSFMSSSIFYPADYSSRPSVKTAAVTPSRKKSQSLVVAKPQSRALENEAPQHSHQTNRRKFMRSIENDLRAYSKKSEQKQEPKYREEENREPCYFQCALDTKAHKEKVKKEIGDFLSSYEVTKQEKRQKEGRAKEAERQRVCSQAQDERSTWLRDKVSRQQLKKKLKQLYAVQRAN